MAKTDPRVDAYIAKAPDFAKPILIEVRARVHKAVPAVEEAIKWNVPFFVIGEKLLVSMGAFKKHAKVVVWRGVWRVAKPQSVDVTTVAELPSAAAFVKDVKAAASEASAESPKKSGTKKASTKKTAAKKTAAKKTAAKKSGAKKPAPRKK